MNFAAATLCGLILALVAAPVPSRAGQEIVTLDTRPRVTLRVLLVTPEAPPAATLVLFPGGVGANDFDLRAGQIHLGSNFLVRTSPLVAEQGLAAAIIDTPSDQRHGMGDWFRTSRAHAEDVRKVLDVLTSRWPGPVYLVGTSRGTLSAAYLAASLHDSRVRGLVLASTMSADGRGRWMSVRQLPIDTVTVRVLFIHHDEDRCEATPIQGARQLAAWFRKSPAVDFIEVVGGDPPRSGPCEPLSAHGFLGQEREVVRALADWIRGRPIPRQIGP